MNDPRDITHNLRTAIIDARETWCKVYTGNEWTPEQVLADLKPRSRSAGCQTRCDRRVHAARAAADRAAADAARGAALSESACPTTTEPRRRRHAAQLSRRRPARLRALPRGGAVRRRRPRAARLSAAGPQLRVDRRARSRDLRLPARAAAGDRSRARAIPGLHGRRPVFATPRALALSYFDPYVDFTGRVTGYAVVDLVGDGRLRLAAGGHERLEGRADAARLPASPNRDRRIARYKRLRARYRAFRAAHGDGSRSTTSGRETWTALPDGVGLEPAGHGIDRTRGYVRSRLRMP